MLYDLNSQMTVFEKMRNKKLPDYYDTMYQDGYSPSEIMEALHNTMIKEHFQRQEARKQVEEDNSPMNVNFNVEVKQR